MAQNSSRIEVVDEFIDEPILVYRCFKCESLFGFYLYTVRNVIEEHARPPEYCPFCGAGRLHV